MLLGESQVTVTWDIPMTQQIGTYRIQYFGNWKAISGSITTFRGTSKQFKVTSLKSYYKNKLRKLTLQQKLKNTITLNNDILESKYKIPQNIG